MALCAQEAPSASDVERAPWLPPEDAEIGVNARLMIGEPAGPPISGAALEVATETLSSRMRCPVCQGLSVADSPSQSALAMKAEVRELLSQGFSDDQILRYFEKAYGEFIRLAPKAEGFNLVVWIAPVLGVALGLGLVAGYLASRRRPAVPGRTGKNAESALEEADAETARALELEPELLPYLERVRREAAEVSA